MTVIATQSIALAGSALTLTSAASSQQVKAGDSTVLEVRNGDSSSHTVTLTTPGTEAGLAIADRVVTVANATTQLIRLTKDLYGDSDGLVTLTWSATTSMTFAAFTV